MNLDAFNKTNKEASEKVAAIKAGDGALSTGDQSLLTAIAAGGMAQLEASQLAIKQAKSADVKAIAKAEVEEQTILKAKLTEIASSRKATLPKELDADGRKLMDLLKDAGDKSDRTYLSESGVKGHEMLQKTMERVKEDAEDDTLKEIATTTLPLIKTHLEVATDESASMA